MIVDDSKGAFCLVNDPWILVSRTDGSSDEVSLRDLLLDAGTIRSIDGDIPQQALPILRLALAVLYRAYCSEAEYDDDKYDLWERLWKSQRFESELINKYLMLWRGNFQLYGSDHPFMQVSGLTYADKDYDRIGEMIADVPKPDKCLFDLRDSRQLESISLDEAARWLVFFQAYDVAGIKTPVTGNKHVTSGKVYPPKGMVGTGFLGVLGGVFLEGENLFQTLLLNWVLVDKASDQVLLGNDDDLPSWERPMPPADLCVVDPTGPCELMTWQSRRVRLVLDEAGRRVVGQVSCYGDTTTANDNQRIEMMTSWRPSKAQQKKLSTSYLPWMPVMHDPSKALWRSLAAIIAQGGNNKGSDGDFRPGVIRWVETLQEDGDVSSSITVHAQGMAYGTQSSVFSDAIDDTFSVDVSMLRHDSEAARKAVEVVSQADSAVYCLVKFAENIEKSAGDKRRDNPARALENDARESAYGRLDAIFRDKLAGLVPGVDVDGYCTSWKDDAHRILLRLGRQYLSRSNVSAFQEHDDMSVGKAWVQYQGGLDAALGRLSKHESEESFGIPNQERKGE